MLTLTREWGEGLKFFLDGKEILHLVVEKGKGGDRVRVLMVAPDEVLIMREELCHPQKESSDVTRM